MSGEDITYQEAWADEEYREDLKAELIDQSVISSSHKIYSVR
ncbi:hypothetical protein ACVNP1_08260 [Staphylococcus aureus]